MQKTIQSRAFTLVELIVVITILAILGTIGFLSFQGYAVSARDSTRVSDLTSIGKVLELFKIQEGSYPISSNSFEVSYSGSLAWDQGTFGEETRQLTQRISDIPVDPLTGNEYAYSTTNTRQEYELGAITENLISYTLPENNTNSLIPSNIANADNSFFTYIKGNYNKQIVTVKDTVQTNRLYILGVPTIITTEITDVTVQDILANQSFSIPGSKNLPSSYASTLPEGQTHTGSTSFTPGTVTLTAPLIYEGTANDLSNEDNRNQFGEDLVSYYANSNVTGQSPYNNIANIPTGEELAYVNTLIQTDTGGLPGEDIVINIVSTSGGGNTTPISSTNPKADPNCYTAPVNTIGAWDGCQDMLIVDNDLIASVSSTNNGGDGSYQLIGPDSNIYIYGDSAYNIFTGQVTDMTGLFTFDYTFNQDIGYWDTSNVAIMEDLFSVAIAFNQDIGGWDVSNVVNMQNILGGTRVFNQDIGGWDVSKVTNMQSMLGSWEFDQDISGWDVSSVETMNAMFSNARVFNQDISGWDVSKVTNMRNMFAGTYVFNQDIGGWDTSNVDDMYNMFGYARAFNQDISTKTITRPDSSTYIAWDISKVDSIQNMFRYTRDFNQDIGGWDTSNITDMIRVFQGSESFNQDLNGWDISSLTTLDGMFEGAVAFNQDLNSWDTSNINRMESTFKGTVAFNGDISSWDTSNVTRTRYMFEDSEAFNQDISTKIITRPDLSTYTAWDMSNNSNAWAMFDNANAFNQDIGGWDTSDMVSMNNMFRNATIFNQDLSCWNVILISSEPSGFKTGSPLINANSPVWGTSPTCP